jgi:hypothetical protein
MFTWAKIAELGLSVINGALSAVNGILARFQRKDDRDAGATAQREVTDEQVISNVATGNAAAADDAVLDLVRNRDQAK